MSAGSEEATAEAGLWAEAEAEERAHDRVSPESTFIGVEAVDLFVEAFLAGAAFAAPPTGASR